MNKVRRHNFNAIIAERNLSLCQRSSYNAFTRQYSDANWIDLAANGTTWLDQSFVGKTIDWFVSVIDPLLWTSNVRTIMDLLMRFITYY